MTPQTRPAGPSACTVAQVEVGPAEHGVVRYARRVRDALARIGAAPVSADESSCTGVHLHFTDRLFGSSPVAAAERFDETAHAARARGHGVVVTLHDVPQGSDGRSEPARRECYRRVARIADGVVVSSDHELKLLSDSGIGGEVEVIPLMVDISRAASFRPPARATVGVLGYLYPGKGHIEVLRATPAEATFTALGTPSPGHDHVVDELRAVTETVEVTGYLDDDAMHRALLDVAVPVAHHLHLSASASITSWIEAGRKPLVVRSTYADEIAARSPGTVTLYDEKDLAEALATALNDPVSTWLAHDADARPTPADVAAAHLRAYAGWFG